jgi:3-phytase
MVDDVRRQVRILTKQSLGAGVLLLVIGAASACGPQRSTEATPPRPEATALLKPAFETDPVPHDADDPAIWVSASDPPVGLILATDKKEAAGGLYVFGLDGKLRQTIAPLDRPNNVDIEYGVTVGGVTVDIAVVTERKQHRLRVFTIPSDGGPLTELVSGGLRVLEGETGEASEPMGIALYKRPRDGAVFAIVSPKTGKSVGYLWQYRLEPAGTTLKTTFVRRFGNFSGIGPSADEAGEIEAVVVDDQPGYVYYSDEQFGIRMWHADPDAAGADTELATFGRGGYGGDREGLAIYAPPGGSGYLVSSDQIEGGTRLHLYGREPLPGRPNDHPLVAIVSTLADDTDGLDVTPRRLPGFPDGLVVMMNSASRNFHVYRWKDVAAAMRQEQARPPSLEP